MVPFGLTVQVETVGPPSRELPKYVRIVNAIRERIADGTYVVGSAIPSEAKLSAAFRTSRPVVVRALGILQQDGWLVSEKGRGRYVRHGRSRVLPHGGLGLSVLREDVDARVCVLSVGQIDAPPAVSAALGLSTASPVIARQRLVTINSGAVQLGTTYVAVGVASGTGLAEERSLGPGGVIDHLRDRKGIRFGHATERIQARPARTHEARLLGINRREWVLTVFVVGFDVEGRSRFVTDAVLPATRRDVEYEFAIG